MTFKRTSEVKLLRKDSTRLQRFLLQQKLVHLCHFSHEVGSHVVNARPFVFLCSSEQDLKRYKLELLSPLPEKSEHANLFRTFEEDSKDDKATPAMADKTLSEDELNAVTDDYDTIWIASLHLRNTDKAILDAPNEWLNDRLIFGGLSLLKKDYSHIAGFMDPVMLQAMRCHFKGQTFVQILHNGSNHWLTATNMDCPVGIVRVYDSLHFAPNQCVKQALALMCHTDKCFLEIQLMDVARQIGSADCGLLALAYATSLCMGQDPVNVMYEQKIIRRHFLECIVSGKMTAFPVNCNRTLRKPISFTTSIQIYCSCRQIYVKGQRMIQCNACDEWYHATCMNLSENAFAQAADETNYICHKCIM